MKKPIQFLGMIIISLFVLIGCNTEDPNSSQVAPQEETLSNNTTPDPVETITPEIELPPSPGLASNLRTGRTTRDLRFPPGEGNQ